MWYSYFSGKSIQFWCDNESVVAIINSGHSKAPRIMDLLRFLVLLSIKHNFYFRARHVPGIVNEFADALSRFQDTRFRAVAPQAESTPCTIPPSLNNPLREELLRYANWGLAWSTNRTYSSDQFCLVDRLFPPGWDILPASEVFILPPI